jgi:hypothetical protein
MENFEPEFVNERILGDADYAEAGRAAYDYSVCLFNGNELIGSATLVSIGNVYGLLTADHVWQRVRRGEDKEHFCILVGSDLQRFEYPFEGCTPIIVGKYSPDHAEQGPDLTFIRLDNFLKLETIKSRKSFYPLEPAKGEMFDVIPYDRSMWLVCGAPAEQSSPSAMDSGELILRVSQFAGGGSFVEKVDRDGFDYVKIKIASGESNYPADYGGVSGGGVWIPIQYSEDPEGTVLKSTMSLLFAGVAYYQHGAEVGYTTLIFHGPKSIYERVRQAVLT